MASHIVLRLLVGIRFQVLFHLPSRRSFHLSLTVLVHYRSLEMFSLTRWSSWIQAGFHVPRPTWEHYKKDQTFAYGTITLCGRTFQTVQLVLHLVTSSKSSYPLHATSHYPCTATCTHLTRHRFRLLPVRSPLLRQSHLLSFRPVT